MDFFFFFFDRNDLTHFYHDQCKYCGEVVSGFFRLKCHLGGIRGDVTHCENAPQNVKELFRNKLLERKIESLSKLMN